MDIEVSDNMFSVIIFLFVIIFLITTTSVIAGNYDSIKNCSLSCGSDQMVSYTETEAKVGRIPNCVCKDGCMK